MHRDTSACAAARGAVAPSACVRHAPSAGDPMCRRSVRQAVGDGAAVGSFLPLLPVDPAPAFGIFLNGTTLLDDDDNRLIENFPCLHVVSGTESSLAASEKLYKQFGGDVYQSKAPSSPSPISSTSHLFTKSTLNAIGKVRLFRTSLAIGCPCCQSLASLLDAIRLHTIVSLSSNKKKPYAGHRKMVSFKCCKISCTW